MNPFASTLKDRLPAAWPVVALSVSAVMLAAAHAFERLGGYAPCLLCLKQREVYWVAGAAALAAALLQRSEHGRALRPWLALGLTLLFLSAPDLPPFMPASNGSGGQVPPPARALAPLSPTST